MKGAAKQAEGPPSGQSIRIIQILSWSLGNTLLLTDTIVTSRRTAWTTFRLADPMHRVIIDMIRMESPGAAIWLMTPAVALCAVEESDFESAPVATTAQPILAQRSIGGAVMLRETRAFVRKLATDHHLPFLI